MQDSFRWNLHPFLDDFIPENLEQSVAKVGILHPPVVIETGLDTYDIVCGRKRIRCGCKLGQADFLCHVLPSASEKLTILNFLVEDQLSLGPLSLPELANSLKLFLYHGGEEKEFALFARQPQPRMRRVHLLSILDLDNPAQRSIHFGTVAEKIIPSLLKCTSEDQSRLIALVEQLQLGEGKQRRLVTLCCDIALREKIFISSLLDRQEIQSIIEHQEMNAPQKAGRLLRLLQKLCFPQSMKAKEAFQNELRTFDLPGHCEITPSPFFEKDEITLSVRFQNLEECRRIFPSFQVLLKQQRQ
jgi:hypothetical protein